MIYGEDQHEDRNDMKLQPSKIKSLLTHSKSPLSGPLQRAAECPEKTVTPLASHSEDTLEHHLSRQSVGDDSQWNFSKQAQWRPLLGVEDIVD